MMILKWLFSIVIVFAAAAVINEVIAVIAANKGFELDGEIKGTLT